MDASVRDDVMDSHDEQCDSTGDILEEPRADRAGRCAATNGRRASCSARSISWSGEVTSAESGVALNRQFDGVVTAGLLKSLVFLADDPGAQRVVPVHEDIEALFQCAAVDRAGDTKNERDVVVDRARLVEEAGLEPVDEPEPFLMIKTAARAPDRSRRSWIRKRCSC